MTVRSGRFKSDNAHDANRLLIIQGNSTPEAGDAYRIFNSGEFPFLVETAPGTPDHRQIEINPHCSIDTKPLPNDIFVTTDTADVKVEGVYEYLKNPGQRRSGRFVSDAATGSPHPTLMFGRNGQFYRVFNSSRTASFTVRPHGAGTTNPRTVLPRASLDFVAGTRVVISGPAGTEAVYEELDGNDSARNGRFRRRVVSGGGSSSTPDTPHLIIDLQGSTNTAWYRLFNSGKHPILISGVAAADMVLAVENSLDFKVGGGVQEVYVKSTASDKAIDGSYVFLGR